MAGHVLGQLLDHLVTQLEAGQLVRKAARIGGSEVADLGTGRGDRGDLRSRRLGRGRRGGGCRRGGRGGRCGRRRRVGSGRLRRRRLRAQLRRQFLAVGRQHAQQFRAQLLSQALRLAPFGGVGTEIAARHPEQDHVTYQQQPKKQFQLHPRPVFLALIDLLVCMDKRSASMVHTRMVAI
ncbi:hypothetical protein FEE59_05415 [Herbaspirillum sp. RU 5E]|nr:hypothetical protein [Herbaspirillum sp. RU 5E]